MTEPAAPYLTYCPVGCIARLETTSIVLPEGTLRRCTECGQLLSQVSDAAYWRSMEQFDEHGYNVLGPRQRARQVHVAHRRLGRICSLLGTTPPQTRLLDVGCSRGDFLVAARGLGFQAEGVEPAPNAAQTAQAAGLKVHVGLLEDVRLADASFDAITLFEVIEHLKHPRSLMAECQRILKPGGIMLLSTGNAASWTARAMGGRWDYFHIAKDGGHVSFYNPRSMALLATRTSFKVARLETARVKFYEKGEVAPWRYAAAKAAAEVLNLPARLARRGHDMLAFLRRK
jgi:2-polyprenyl-3-methyl-5-hydroxy-6-metoxy-1,4-benzoquinol methylase